jgi:hypothetical protein
MSRDAVAARAIRLRGASLGPGPFADRDRVAMCNRQAS